MLAGMAGAKEKAPTQVAPHQGVELLFPANTGNQAKGNGLSKDGKSAASLLKKLKAIEKGGDINATDKQGKTALMYAAAANNRLAVCWLVAKGADAAIKSKSGKTAGDFVKEENANMKELLKACCEEKQPLPEEEKSYFESEEEAQRRLERDQDSVYWTAIALRAGAHADRLHPENKRFLFSDNPEESLAFLIRHGMPVAPFNKTDWKDATPLHLRLLLACGMPKESDETRKNLIFALLLDDVPGIETCLQQESECAKEAEYYGRAQSAAAVQTLLKAAGGVPDATACLKAVLATSYNGAVVKALLNAGVPVPTDEETLELLVPNYYTGEDYTTYRGELRSKPDVVQAMLDAGLDPNYTFSDGNTLLHRAAYHGNLSIVCALLKKGADANAPDKKDQPPLSRIFANMHEGGYAAHEGDIVQALLKAGAKVNSDELGKKLASYALDRGIVIPLSRREQNEFIAGLQALLKAGFKVPADILLNFGNRNMPDAKWEEIALLLLEHGADPKATSNEKWDNGKTTLMGAGCLGTRIAQKLLDAGVDPNTVTADGDSALKNALTENHTEVSKLLHDKGARYSGELFICHPDCMQIMLEDGAKIPATIYEDLFDHGAMHSSHLALTQEQYARVIELLKKAGAAPDSVVFNNLKARNKVAKRAFVSSFQDPKTRDKDGNTLLFLAEGSDIEKLVWAGVDPHAVNNKGQTPLFRPLSLEEIRTLMRLGVRINTQDHDGNTALMVLVQRGGYDETVKDFLVAGADPNVKNKAGKTALQIAREKKQDKVVKLLKEYGAREEKSDLPNDKKSDPSNEKKNDPNEKDARGLTRLMLAVRKNGSEGEIQSLLRQGADVNARDNDGNTALHHLLTVVGNIDARLNALLAAHPDVNLTTHTGTTPLMILDVCRDPKECTSRVKKLLELHAKVDLKDSGGRTAAMRYVEKGDNARALQLLLDAGADPKLRNKDGKTLLQLAQQYKRTACVRLLQKRLTPLSPAKPLPASSSGHWWWYIIGGALLVLLVACVGRRLRRKK